MTPALAVTIPTESILVTSSYVKVPPILTSPVNVAAAPVIFPLNPNAVTIPALTTFSTFDANVDTPVTYNCQLNAVLSSTVKIPPTVKFPLLSETLLTLNALYATISTISPF